MDYEKLYKAYYLQVPFDGVYDMEDGIIATPLDPDITFSDEIGRASCRERV